MKTPLRILTTLSLAFSLTASAGATYSGYSCHKNADGSGSCSGSFQSVRNNAPSGDQILFRQMSSTYRNFYARWTTTGTSWTSAVCAANDSLYPSVTAMWPLAMNAKGYFYVAWDADGYCSYLEILNGSAYSSF